MALERSPPQSSMSGLASPQIPSVANTSESCPICCECLDGKIDCLIIVSCSHAFHRPCIEKHLSKENECPVCRLPCQLSDLQKFYLPGRTMKSKPVKRGGLAKQYQTRSSNRNILNDSQPPLIQLSGNANSELVNAPSGLIDNPSEILGEDNSGDNQISNVRNRSSNISMT